MQRCGPSGTFLLSAFFGMFDFGMFKFGHLHAKMRSFRHVSSFYVLRHVLILACLSLVICMQRCGPSGMFLLSAFFGMFDFGMFKFGQLHAKMRSLPACFFVPRASACLILACLITFFCRPAAFHTHTLPARCWSCSWSRDAVLPACFFFPRSSACLILACLSLVICMQRCGPSGMFLCSACFGMFDFGMFNYFLLSACCIPHTHTSGQVLVLLVVERCGPSGMFLRSACFGMFDFGMFNYFLLSACCIPHTHTSGQVLVLLVVERQGSTALQQRCATQT